MKVLLCHNHYRTSSPSGEDLAFGNEKALLAESGVEIFTYEKFNDELDDRTLRSKLSIGVNTIWSRSTYREISELIKEIRPNVAHFHNTFPQISPSAYKACHDCNVPVVQTLHNYRLVCPSGLMVRNGEPCRLCVSNSLLSSVQHQCYRSSRPATSVVAAMLMFNRVLKTYTKYVDRYIALTNFAAEQLAAGGIPSSKISIKPNFVRTTNKTMPTNHGEAIIYIGRLSKEKGVETLIKAWRRVSDLELIIVGDGPLRDDLERYVKTNDLNVKFLGHVPQAKTIELLAQSKIIVIPSECYENFPLVVLEAFSSGTPIAASNIGSLAEIIKDGETGLLFEPRNEIDLAKNIAKLATKLDRVQIAKAAFSAYTNAYTPRKNFERLSEIYKEVLKR